MRSKYFVAVCRRPDGESCPQVEQAKSTEYCFVASDYDNAVIKARELARKYPMFEVRIGRFENCFSYVNPQPDILRETL